MTISITGRRVCSPEERNRLFMYYVAPHMTNLRRFVYILTRPDEDPDDNFQEVLIALLRAVELYDPAVAGFTCWMDRVVRNTIVNLRRHNRLNIPTAPLEAAPANSSAPEAVPVPDFGAADAASPAIPPLIIDRDDYPTTYDALMKLPALQRHALLMSVEGWRTADIAESLRLTPENVRKMISRAKGTVAASVHIPAIAAKY